MNLRKNVLQLFAAAFMLAGLSVASPALAQEADLLVTVSGTATGNVGFGKSVGHKVKVANKGTVAAAGVTVTLDVAAWPADQVITGVSGCTPAALPVGTTTRTNESWFPCTFSADIAPDVAAQVGPPAVAAVDNAKTATVTVKYGVAPTAAELYNADGSKIASAWVCPAVDQYAAVTASAATTTAETNPADNTATRAALVALWAEVKVTTTGPATLAEGANFTVDFTVFNDGPCTVSTDVAVSDPLTNLFSFVSATGICAGLTGDYALDADGNIEDYQYCPVDDLAPGASAVGTKTYYFNSLPSDLTSTRQVTGIQITYGAGDYTEVKASNDVSDVEWIVTQSAGCSSAGAGGPTGLLALGAALALVFRRRRAV